MSNKPVAMPEFRVMHRDHTPFNKYRHEVEDGVCEVRVKDYDGTGANPEAWLEITLSETYTPAGSKRSLTRTISATLKADERAKLIAMLQSTERKA